MHSDPIVLLLQELDEAFVSNREVSFESLRNTLERIRQRDFRSSSNESPLYSLIAQRAVLERLICAGIDRHLGVEKVRQMFDARAELEFDDPICEWLNSCQFIRLVSQEGQVDEARQICEEIKSQLLDLQEGCRETLEQIEQELVKLADQS